jgi:hypothetical protein
LLIGSTAFVAVATLFFVVIPTSKVDPWVRAPSDSPSYFIAPGVTAQEPGPGLYHKSGLRLAIEGRLRWLGVL